MGQRFNCATTAGLLALLPVVALVGAQQAAPQPAVPPAVAQVSFTALPRWSITVL
jgi:hypothetical protein